MGPIRKKKNNNAVYNPTLLENWTIARLKAELERKNIAFPLNAKRLTLVRLLKRYENSDSITSNTTNARGEEARGENTRGEEPINGSAVYHHALPLQNARVDGDPRSHDAPNINNNENTPSNDNRVLIGIVSKLSSTVQSLQQNVSGLTGKVNLLLQARNENTSISRIAETPNVRWIVESSIKLTNSSQCSPHTMHRTQPQEARNSF
ncbi:unnamed protein product [Mytilus edulis]|uniref:Uncharacterized protein n=1 Tax=Mytilus edulis TaxID=6550 RepID=A0A8S3QN31_MYTED|nr:unnamed protein product [Mytilus edulis]